MLKQNLMEGWHYGKGLIYYRPIFRLTKLAFLRARAIQSSLGIAQASAFKQRQRRYS